MLGLYGAFGYDLTFQFEPIRMTQQRDDNQRDMVSCPPPPLPPPLRAIPARSKKQRERFLVGRAEVPCATRWPISGRGRPAFMPLRFASSAHPRSPLQRLDSSHHSSPLLGIRRCFTSRTSCSSSTSTHARAGASRTTLRIGTRRPRGCHARVPPFHMCRSPRRTSPFDEITRKANLPVKSSVPRRSLSAAISSRWFSRKPLARRALTRRRPSSFGSASAIPRRTDSS